FIVRDLIGLGDGVGWSLGQAMMSKISTPSRRSLNLGIFSAGYTIVGVGLGAIIMTQLAIHAGWRNVYWILAIPMVVVVAVLWKLLPAIRPEDMVHLEGLGGRSAKKEVHYWQLLTNPQMILLIFINIVILGWIQGFNGYSALFLQSKHYPMSQIGYLLSVGGLLGCAGQLVLPVVSNYIGRKKVTWVSLALPAVATLVISTMPVGTGVLTASIAVIGFFAWAVIPLASATIISEMVPPSQLASAMGLTNFFGVALGSFVLPPTLGWIADHHGISAAFLTIGLVLAFGALCCTFLKETLPQNWGSSGKIQKEQAL
ncbi:MAG: MFS transporter, partial [Alicyclobacillus sp.]|nr:MFS transporter [Alicyclobacillus sp.]